MVTAVLLENQEQTQREEREFLSEQPTVTTGSSGATAGFSAGATELESQSLVSTQYL